MRITRSRLCRRSGIFTLLFSSLALPCVAQTVVSDRTTNTVVTGTNSFSITEGTQSSTALFHSFLEFSPGAFDVTFELDSSQSVVDTVISRVTGGNSSFINGQLELTGGDSPDLFFINPNGITFGSDASLSLLGSFIPSTAESVLFSNGLEFSAGAMNPAPLLTLSTPTGLQMGTNPGAIRVDGPGHQMTNATNGGFFPQPVTNPVGLQLSPNKTLALAGGEVTLAGGILTAPSGHIEIGSAQSGSIGLVFDGDSWRFDYTDISQFQDIVLSQRALLDSSGDGGSLRLQGENVKWSDSSFALVRHTGAQTGGDIVINAVEAVEFEAQPGELPTQIEAQALGIGTGGEVQITTQRLRLFNSAINTVSSGPGRAGSIRIDATDSVELTGLLDGSITGRVEEAGRIGAVGLRSGGTGEITVDTERLRLSNSSRIFSSGFGLENNGDVIVNATESIEISGISPQGVGSSLTRATLGEGDGGNLILNTQRLTLTDGGFITTSTAGSGNAGNLVIDASEKIEIDGSLADPSRDYPGSSITANAESPLPILQMLFGLPPIPSGDAGSITIDTPELTLSNGARVGVDSIGSGNAGDLEVFADQLWLRDGSQLLASTASGEGGNINLDLDRLLLLRGESQINAQSGGTGSGGDIAIAAPVIVGIENSDIIANAVQGMGGNIELSTRQVIGLVPSSQLTVNSDISASSEFGVDGVVEITNLALNPAASTVELPRAPIDADDRVATTCGSGEGSRFIASGRGGIPTSPMSLVANTRPWTDLRDLSAVSGGRLESPGGFVRSPSNTQSTDSENPLLEATSWRRLPNGRIALFTDEKGIYLESALVSCLTRKNRS